MDFITCLPKVLGKDCIFLVVDILTKFYHFFVITTSFTLEQVADLFFREVFRLHGLPKSIVSDRNNWCLSAIWKKLFKIVETNFPPIKRYNPQIDIQT